MTEFSSRKTAKPRSACSPTLNSWPANWLRYGFRFDVATREFIRSELEDLSRELAANPDSDVEADAPRPNTSGERSGQSATRSISAMTAVSREAIDAALATVQDPEIRRPLTELKMIKSVEISDNGAVTVEIWLTVSGCPMRDEITGRVSEAVASVSGVTDVRGP